jgi:hypothetical protein
MALFDNGFRVGAGLAIGLGAIILAPIVIPVVAAVAKPLVKAGIKGGLLLFEKSKEVLAETQEMIEDLTAEVKAELHQQHVAVAPDATAAGETAGNAS